MKNSAFIQILKGQTEELRNLLSELETLPLELKTAAPSEGSWTVAQCLDHMNIATELYLDQLEAKISTLKPSKTDVYNGTFLGGYFSKSLAPTEGGEIKSKMKTLKVFIPADQPSYDEVAARFSQNLDRYEKILIVCSGMNLRSFKVTTALGPILKFYVGDAMKFIQAHNLRHAQQIRNILAAVSEPVA